jgi:hypothetical protein
VVLRLFSHPPPPPLISAQVRSVATSGCAVCTTEDMCGNVVCLRDARSIVRRPSRAGLAAARSAAHNAALAAYRKRECARRHVFDGAPDPQCFRAPQWGMDVCRPVF